MTLHEWHQFLFGLVMGGCFGRILLEVLIWSTASEPPHPTAGRNTNNE